MIQRESWLLLAEMRKYILQLCLLLSMIKFGFSCGFLPRNQLGEYLPYRVANIWDIRAGRQMHKLLGHTKWIR
jgi:hypothetical protein